MEASALSIAYQVWMGNNPAVFKDFLQDDNSASMSIRVALIGCTVVESGRIVSGIVSCGINRKSIHLTLVNPLGTCDNPYCFWVEDDDQNLDLSGVDLVRELASLGIFDCHVLAVEKDLNCLPEEPFNIVVVGPLAFGALEGGKASFNAIDRASLVFSLMDKACTDNGQIWFSIPKSSRRGKGIPSEISIDEQFRKSMFRHNLGDFYFESFPIGAELAIPAHTNRIEQILTISTYNRNCSITKSKLTRTVSKTSSSEMMLESAILFVGSKKYQNFKEFVVAPRAAIACNSSNLRSIISHNVNGKIDFRKDESDFSDSESKEKNGEFVNIGLELWEMQRQEWKSEMQLQEWKSARCISSSKSSVPFEYEKVIAGIRGSGKTYDLPHPMRLSDLVHMYLDLWNWGIDT